MQTDWKCKDQASGPSGNRTFHFRNYKLQVNNHHPNGPPYFHFNGHKINLRQSGNDISVTAQLRVNSHGYKTSAKHPAGVAPQIGYQVTFSDSSVENVPALLTVPFECETSNQLCKESATIGGRNANDVVKVCWVFSTEYRIVECGSNNKELYGSEWYGGC